jgi:hypothetical protein
MKRRLEKKQKLKQKHKLSRTSGEPWREFDALAGARDIDERKY